MVNLNLMNLSYREIAPFNVSSFYHMQLKVLNEAQKFASKQPVPWISTQLKNALVFLGKKINYYIFRDYFVLYDDRNSTIADDFVEERDVEAPRFTRNPFFRALFAI